MNGGISVADGVGLSVRVGAGVRVDAGVRDSMSEQPVSRRDKSRKSGSRRFMGLDI